MKKSSKPLKNTVKTIKTFDLIARANKQPQAQGSHLLNQKIQFLSLHSKMLKTFYASLNDQCFHHIVLLFQPVKIMFMTGSIYKNPRFPIHLKGIKKGSHSQKQQEYPFEFHTIQKLLLMVFHIDKY
jgi:hypothetical protein